METLLYLRSIIQGNYLHHLTHVMQLHHTIMHEHTHGVSCPFITT